MALHVYVHKHTDICTVTPNTNWLTAVWCTGDILNDNPLNTGEQIFGVSRKKCKFLGYAELRLSNK